MASEKEASGPAKESHPANSWPLKNMDIISDLWKQGFLCDVTLVVEGRHFLAHRVVLAAASQYFRLMFTSGMRESWSTKVVLKGTEAETMELLLNFIYTGRISVKERNALPLLYAADQFQVDPVKKICVELIKGQLDASNCLGFSTLAEVIHSPDLKTKADDFVQSHFSEVIKLDEFLHLDICQLTQLLRQDVLCVAEEQIYNAARRWLMHDLPTRHQFLVTAFSCVRFPLLAKTFLSNTVQADPLIQENLECLKMLIGGMRFHTFNCKEDKKLDPVRPRRMQTHRVAVFSVQSFQFFNPMALSWTGKPRSVVLPLNAAAVCYDKVFYIIGGSSDSTLVPNMSCYNIEQDTWISRTGPPIPRFRLAVCAYQRKIYASGGAAENLSALDVFESYDIKTDSWQMEQSMLVRRRCHGCVEVGGLIYVCGGVAGVGLPGTILRNMEVYNPSTKQWTALRGMKFARKNHGLVVVGGRIYAVGGQGSKGKLASVEYYDIGSNQWHRVASMPRSCLTVGCSAVGDVLYVLAGKNGAGNLQYIMKYCTQSNRWKTDFSVRAFTESSCMVCAVDL